MSRFCVICGRELPGAARFCRRCGTAAYRPDADVETIYFRDKGFRISNRQVVIGRRSYGLSRINGFQLICRFSSASVAAAVCGGGSLLALLFAPTSSPLWLAFVVAGLLMGTAVLLSIFFEMTAYDLMLSVDGASAVAYTCYTPGRSQRVKQAMARALAEADAPFHGLGLGKTLRAHSMEVASLPHR